MSANQSNKITRRALLRAAGGMAGALAWANTALARKLIVVASVPSAPISQIEWIIYNTGQLDRAGVSIHRGAVRLTTTEGAQGWADFNASVAPSPDVATLVESILLGQDPANHESLWKQLYGQAVPIGPLSAVDVALWDLRGRIAGQPVSVLLRGQRQRIPCYVSSGSLLAEPSQYADFAVTCQEQGIAGVKVQPATGDPAADLAVYEAVREAVSPGFACIAGGPGDYTYEQALLVGRGLDQLGYAWYEQPMPENDQTMASYAALVEALATPICAPKNASGLHQSRIAWIESQACDIACIDVHHGGLTACIQLANYCQSQGVPLELSNIGLDAYPHIQLAAATDAAVIGQLELLSLSTEPQVAPGRATPEPVFDEEGFIAVSESPGMGLELDWTYIFTHRVS